MLKYLFPFITAFFLAVFLIILAIWIGKKFKWYGRKSQRHIHSDEVSRMGGLILVIVFNLVILTNPDLFISSELYGFLIGTMMLLIVGCWDDLKEIFWKIQMFIQIAVSILVFILGVRIYCVTNPFFGGMIELDSGLGVIISAGLVVFWIVMVINALNWADGIDGLSGGITFITILTILFLSFRPEVNQPPVAIICSILLGIIAAFLIFNFYPSKILAGTAGSMFMGFSIAVLAIFSGTKIATALLVLAIPIIDFFWVIGERIRRKKSIFIPDRNHLHYKLMELGWSQKKIVLAYWAITAVIAFIALNTRIIGKSVTLALVAVIMVVVLLWINKKISRINPA